MHSSFWDVLGKAIALLVSRAKVKGYTFEVLIPEGLAVSG
jgi:hypothetical protein